MARISFITFMKTWSPSPPPTAYAGKAAMHFHYDAADSDLLDGFKGVRRFGHAYIPMDETLARCYRASLWLAEEAGLASVAFPSIATGIYGFPIERASRIAVREIRAFLAIASRVRLVKVVTFRDADHATYLAAVAGTEPG